MWLFQYVFGCFKQAWQNLFRRNELNVQGLRCGRGAGALPAATAPGRHRAAHTVDNSPSPLASLPTTVLTKHVWPHLGPWSRAQLRASCRELRAAIDTLPITTLTCIVGLDTGTCRHLGAPSPGTPPGGVVSLLRRHPALTTLRLVAESDEQAHGTPRSFSVLCQAFQHLQDAGVGARLHHLHFVCHAHLSYHPSLLTSIAAACPNLLSFHLFQGALDRQVLGSKREWEAGFRALPCTLTDLTLRLGDTYNGMTHAPIPDAVGSTTHLTALTTLVINNMSAVNAAAFIPLCSSAPRLAHLQLAASSCGTCTNLPHLVCTLGTSLTSLAVQPEHGFGRLLTSHCPQLQALTLLLPYERLSAADLAPLTTLTALTALAVNSRRVWEWMSGSGRRGPGGEAGGENGDGEGPLPAGAFGRLTLFELGSLLGEQRSMEELGAITWLLSSPLSMLGRTCTVVINCPIKPDNSNAHDCAALADALRARPFAARPALKPSSTPPTPSALLLKPITHLSPLLSRTGLLALLAPLRACYLCTGAVDFHSAQQVLQYLDWVAAGGAQLEVLSLELPQVSLRTGSGRSPRANGILLHPLPHLARLLEEGALPRLRVLQVRGAHVLAGRQSGTLVVEDLVGAAARRRRGGVGAATGAGPALGADGGEGRAAAGKEGAVAWVGHGAVGGSGADAGGGSGGNGGGEGLGGEVEMVEEGGLVVQLVAGRGHEHEVVEMVGQVRGRLAGLGVDPDALHCLLGGA